MSTSVNMKQAVLSLGLGTPREVVLGMSVGAWRLAMCGLLLTACSQRTASAEQLPTVSSEPTSRTLSVEPASSAPSTGPREEGDETGLRRGYGVVDMRFNACVKRESDYAFSGKGCPPGFLIYGPYVPVPAASEIEVSFEVTASKPIAIYSDIVSRMGVQMLAGLSRQKIDANTPEKLGYRVYVFNADANVESRIGMDAEPGTDFQITNLTMTVR
jgi:hypothetical protein